jgi:hypothetical protein
VCTGSALSKKNLDRKQIYQSRGYFELPSDQVLNFAVMVELKLCGFGRVEKALRSWFSSNFAVMVHLKSFAVLVELKLCGHG